MRSECTITILSVNKKPDEETPTRLRRIKPDEKVMMLIFWDKYGILLTKYLPRRTTISGPYYASVIKRLHCAIVEKRRDKVSDGVLLLHDDVPIHKCTVVQTAIRKADFVDLNHLAYSSDITLPDYYLFPNLKKFLRGKNFSYDDETIDTVEDSLNKRD